ncbi:MAG: hypothetical protein OXI30_11945 [Chloroflexota bacterium]|nr:hypothetical protein [Chloroflexota bacterium]
MQSRRIPQFRLFLRMVGLTLLWCVAVGVANHAAEGHWPTVEHAFSFLVTCTKAGAVLGVIALVVALAFGRVRNPRRFKLAMALCICALPACATTFILIIIWAFSSELSIAGYIHLLLICSNLPFALWFSQIAARKYLRDISSEKRKGRPAPGRA